MTDKAAGDKAAFCASLRWVIEVDWFDRTGYHQIDGDRRARLDLSTYGHGGHYEGFYVEIISKATGRIDRKWFAFDDYLPHSARCDGRSADYPSHGNTVFEVIDHIGWDWYIAVPASTRPFTEAVERYIDLFR